MTNRGFGQLVAAICFGFLVSGCVTTEHQPVADEVTRPVALDPAPTPSTPHYSLPFEDNPSKLFGLSDIQVTHIFGEPGFRRRDNPAEIWRYKAAGCILDVFLYPEGTSYRVAHAEVRDPVADQQPISDHCLSSIVDGRNG